MKTTLNRADLVAAFPNITPKALRGLEDQAQAVSDASDTATAAVAATQGINEATVLVLSPNDAFDNERVLAVGSALSLTDGGPGKQLTLRMKYPITTTGGYRITFNAPSDVNIALPPTGKLAITEPPGPYADDATAASNGVAVGEMYAATGGVVHWRVS